ncbi:MAG TPA: translational GTPase TypA [Firmicutes bacterium]|nr:translational GTPase TypA [Bacillota bacterium]
MDQVKVFGPESIRNIAIIAHVDHGKTTLVDAMLKQSGIFRENQQVGERIMDCNDIERERGITILSKNTAIVYKGCKINIVDTPGHADFSGEVERVLGMVDGALLVVDAFEGPMPQTRFVLSKALAQRLKPILVVNKIDRPGARPKEVVDQVLDLFIALGANEEQIDFPVIYTDARAGKAGFEPNSVGDNIYPLLDTILTQIPHPSGDPAESLQFQVSTLDYDEYVGRIVIGRITRGTLHKGDKVGLCSSSGEVRPIEVTMLYSFSALKRVPVEMALAGDIVAVAGADQVNIGDTFCDIEHPEPLPPIVVEEPTITMRFSVNDSPFAGREGKYVTSRHLRERLFREAQTDVGLRVEETDTPETFQVSGRGELHLSILIEKMRREGYELAVSKPKVIMKRINGQLQEPIELLVIDTPEMYMGAVMESLGPRKGELRKLEPSGDGRVRLEVLIPSRGLMGFRQQFLTVTKGNGIMYHRFERYGEYKGEIPPRQTGSLVAWETGTTTSYALDNAQERGSLFVGPGEWVYEGQIVGESPKGKDIDINVCKKKHVTNMRSSTAEEGIRLTPPVRLTLEQALDWIADDELVEVTPKSIRLRKQVLDRGERYRLRRPSAEESESA